MRNANYFCFVTRALQNNPNMPTSLSNPLQVFINDQTQIAKANVESNQHRLEKKEAGLVTLNQIKQSYSDLDSFLMRYPGIKSYIIKEMEPIAVRTSPVYTGDVNVDPSHQEPHKKDNPTKRALNAMEAAIYIQKPNKNTPRILTEYGEQLKQEWGDAKFDRATQLLDNQLAELGSLVAMTNLEKGTENGAYASTFKNRSIAVGIEEEVDFTNLEKNEVIYCKDDQLDLVERLKKDGKLNDFSPNELETGVIRYINRQNEVLIPKNKTKKSVDVMQEMKLSQPLYIMHQAQTKQEELMANNTTTPKPE